MKKFILTTILIMVSIFGFGQVTNNFQDGNWLYYYNRCWGIGPNDNYFGTKVIGNGAGFNGTDVMETAQLKGNSEICRLVSPWTHVVPGNITFDHIVYDKASNENIVLKVISKSENGSENELFVYTYTDGNAKSTSFPVTLNGNYKIIWKWEGNTQKARVQLDNIVIPGTNVSDPSNNCGIYVPPVIDTVYNYYPASDTSTLAFEDLWPSYGDYDMNDLVIGYKFKIKSYNNYVVSVDGTFIVRADGAGLHNGFGFQFPVIPSNILSVNGCGSQDGYIMASNGTELGNSNKATFIVFDDQHKFMSQWNTIKGGPTCPQYTFNVHIKFVANTTTLQQLLIQTWNPFIVKGGVRGQEVHLPNYLPTQLVDPSLFGTENDDTQPGIKYYKSVNNLPWALDIVGKFDYPIEKSDISNAYLHFQDWVLSGGVNYKDWWSNTSTGYRDNNLIY